MGSIWGRNVGQFVVPHMVTKCSFYVVFINVLPVVMEPVTEENKIQKGFVLRRKKQVADRPLLRRGKGSKLNWVEWLVASGWLVGCCRLLAGLLLVGLLVRSSQVAD